MHYTSEQGNLISHNYGWRLHRDVRASKPRAQLYQDTGVFDVIDQCCSFQRRAALSASDVHVACNAAMENAENLDLS